MVVYWFWKTMLIRFCPSQKIYIRHLQFRSLPISSKMMYLRFFIISGIIISFLASWSSVSAKNEENNERQSVVTDSWARLPLQIKQDKDTSETDGNKSGKISQKTNLSEKTNLSGSVDTWSTFENNDSEKRKVEIRLKREINSYIIESYKAQWNKIIKDLSIKLTKAIPEESERKLAYEKIQDSLKSRLEKTEDLEGSDSKKEILQEFLKHLIQLLDKKIDEIEK